MHIQYQLQAQKAQWLSQLQQIIKVDTTEATKQEPKLHPDTKDLIHQSIVVCLPLSALQILGHSTTQALLMATPVVELHLSEIPIKHLYKIQEKVLHELSARHLGLSDEYQELATQHVELK